MWNTDSWKHVRNFISHEDRVTSVTLRTSGHHAKPNGLLLTASKDKTIIYWDVTKVYGKSYNVL